MLRKSPAVQCGALFVEALILEAHDKQVDIDEPKVDKILIKKIADKPYL